MTDEFAHAVQGLRPQLLRFAHAQLRNDAWAEDAVSETVLAALARPQAFGGQSQLKTWLVGILKHKLIDQIRRHSKEVSATTEDDGEDIDALLFNDGGEWREAPAEWGDPEATLRQREFFEVLEVCVEQLPGVQGRIFMMREWLELGTDEVCKELGITATNAWVLLHRARLRLQMCLQERWFGARGSATP
ncbi:MAG TPA: sigma-70 family RNA polymerase sigma factor [Burkholderiaceae bacterium]|nr:sigma-70 family RNA polymerase sigma factor [Burkholderiaceae bacterium]